MALVGALARAGGGEQHSSVARKLVPFVRPPIFPGLCAFAVAVLTGSSGAASAPVTVLGLADTPDYPRVELTTTLLGSIVGLGVRQNGVKGITLGPRGWQASAELGSGIGRVGAVLLAGETGDRAEALVVRVKGERRVVARKALSWSPAEGWRSAADRFPNFGDPLRMSVAADASGQMHAAWLADVAGSASGRAIEVATRSPSGVWSAPLRLAFDPSTAVLSETPRLVVGEGGDIAVMWGRATSPTAREIEIAVQPFGGAFGAPEVLSTSGVRSDGDMAVSPTGSVLAAWIETARRGSELHWRSRSRDGEWSATRLLASGSLARSSVTINTIGEAFIAWADAARDAPATLVLAQVDTTTGESRLRARIAASSPIARLSQVGLTSPAGGNIVLAWRELRGTGSTATARIRSWRVRLTPSGRQLTELPQVEKVERSSSDGFASMPVRLVASRSGVLALGWGSCVRARPSARCQVRVASLR